MKGGSGDFFFVFFLFVFFFEKEVHFEKRKYGLRFKDSAVLTRVVREIIFF